MHEMRTVFQQPRTLELLILKISVPLRMKHDDMKIEIKRSAYFTDLKSRKIKANGDKRNR